MKTQREDSKALRHDNDLEIRTNVQERDEDDILNYSTSSIFGPCCTNGCQYCRPNCHEKSDRLDFF
ncbi:hypothetical protein [Desulfosporosinus sp. BICA1-9]|uniref:hypothetical protein n=1 Tax=Desulfosporosinus sp. BICA1-9 TaxID=1531958 RepID=UPI00054B6DF8|nr:hypothetical protein [Desulfosporosinus sp. BICA1-9]KJS46262.1 MAG: hypothetical protein VR66_26370 [Peptococcaceae bacterium BRH_c23]KJS80742.1 MAG: hypothetical protein JL57_27480 [Desulfosporosinus sp. BICA1-9]